MSAPAEQNDITKSFTDDGTTPKGREGVRGMFHQPAERCQTALTRRVWKMQENVQNG